ncbi:hypothetical protein BU23DRAFT_155997 [Bimuria novae-zelandiae CBS 107.79]|uniref:Uncharacterized protein n=1 Tax=Bimuria novae-zelandiae CBS 107.79 TaxID=1447943 RepID=A0A6A5V5F4_9PLEO|nr:hypothetical protein BU23DRAFT_155997 [Bimuria novae-zelandiae CBS 107.79]
MPLEGMRVVHTGVLYTCRLRSTRTLCIFRRSISWTADVSCGRPAQCPPPMKHTDGVGTVHCTLSNTDCVHLCRAYQTYQVGVRPYVCLCALRIQLDKPRITAYTRVSLRRKIGLHMPPWSRCAGSTQYSIAVGAARSSCNLLTACPFSLPS